MFRVARVIVPSTGVDECGTLLKHRPNHRGGAFERTVEKSGGSRGDNVEDTRKVSS